MYRRERSPAEVPLYRFIDPKAGCPPPAQIATSHFASGAVHPVIGLLRAR